MEDVQKLVDQGKLKEANELAKIYAINALQASALIYQKLNNLEESIKLSKMCVEINPNNAINYANLCYFFSNKMMSLEAFEAAKQSFILNPTIEAGINVGIILSSMNRVDEAIDCYETLLQKEPNQPKAKFNLGCMYMHKERYLEGLKNLEYRFENENSLKKFKSRFSKPCWDGKVDLNGKKILIFNEQGLGDAIQFLRYVPLLKKRGAFVITECQEELEGLFKGFFDQIICRDFDNPKFPDHDYVVSFSSLSYLLDPELKYIPETPYLFAKPFDFKNNKFKIGIVWAGNPDHPNDLIRSCKFKHFLPLTKIPGVDVYSLQLLSNMKRRWFDEEADLSEEFHDSGVISLSLDNFCKTASYIQGLDLVVTIDTSIVHLAGAMGKKVYMIPTFCSDCRWGIKKKKTHWYKSVKIFRQRKINDWDYAMQKVTKDINHLLFKKM